VALADIAPDIAFSKLPVITDFEIIEELGKGGFGTVWLGKLQETGEFVAIKQLDLTENADNQQIQEKYRDFNHECYLMRHGQLF